MAHEEFIAKQKTPAQFLAHIVEEAGETTEAIGKLVQAAGKTFRFGPDSVNPLLPAEQQERNIDWVLRTADEVVAEANDLIAAIQRFRIKLSIECIQSSDKS